jgi:glycosyltransferase involved in cell wall biosynthesis
VVVDDGSPDMETEAICQSYQQVRYYRINREPVYRNPSVARNLAYEVARGEVLILQSDDVVHEGNAIQKLVELIEPGRFVISTVFNIDWKTKEKVGSHGGKWFQYTGPIIDRKLSPNPMRPLFFLGSVYKQDVLDIGGCDEDFVEPGREDVWFGKCLINELNLQPLYTKEVVGLHINHERPGDLPTRAARSALVYRQKEKEARKTGIWRARKGIGVSGGG